MQLHYKSTGSGDPVIILHGLFGMLDNWQTFARRLSESYRVITPDLRNHGRSPHSENFTYQVMADDIRELIETEQLQDAVLMGHSLGGKVAMQTAMTWPEIVTSLIIVDIAPRAYPPGHDTIIDALQSVDPSITDSRSDIEDQLMGRLDNLNIVRFLLKNLSRTSDGKLSWRMNLPVLADRYDNVIAEVTGTPYNGPTLFVRGGNSRYIHDADIDSIHKLFPRAKLKTVQGAGHWVHADAMEELLKLTTDFLGQ